VVSFMAAPWQDDSWPEYTADVTRATSAGVLASTAVPARPGQGTRHLLVLHGIYGRGRNWTTIARHVVAARADWSCLLLDLRAHGASPTMAPPHTVAAAAGDVGAFEDATGWHASAVAGHSFGGKVALAHAATGRDRLQQVWVIDSTPETREPSGSAWRLIEVVRSLPPSFVSRAEAASGIEASGYSRSVAVWMASNLEHREGRYHWRLDYAVMESLLRDFFQTDLWQVVEAPPEDMEIHFVKASASSVLSEDGCRRIEAAGRASGRVFLHRVEGGHWLTTDNPAAILALLGRHLPGAAVSSRSRA
jgi:pimeloyl-ACP methyl ester carboxylesterase